MELATPLFWLYFCCLKGRLWFLLSQTGGWGGWGRGGGGGCIICSSTYDLGRDKSEWLFSGNWVMLLSLLLGRMVKRPVWFQADEINWMSLVKPLTFTLAGSAQTFSPPPPPPFLCLRSLSLSPRLFPPPPPPVSLPPSLSPLFLTFLPLLSLSPSPSLSLSLSLSPSLSLSLPPPSPYPVGKTRSASNLRDCNLMCFVSFWLPVS